MVDISDPTQPVQLNSYNTNGCAFGVFVDGQIAYGIGSSTLQIMNFSDPLNPTVLNRTFIGPAFDIEIVGTIAYVGGNSGLKVMDVSDPTNPAQIGAYNLPKAILELAVLGDFVYAGTFDGNIVIIDVSDPKAPTLKGSYSGLAGVKGLYVSDNLVYVAALTDGLVIINAANPTTLTEVGAFDIPDIALDIQVKNNLAYLTTEYEGLLILDVSNPAMPTLIDSDTTNDAKFLQEILIKDGLIYTAGNGGLPIWRYITEVEPNDSTIDAMDIGVGNDNIVNATIVTPDDIDYFKFTAEANRPYVIETLNPQGTPSNRGTGLRLYNSAETEIASDPNGANGTGNVDARITFTSEVSGTYFISVASTTSENWTGSYSLGIRTEYTLFLPIIIKR